MSDTVILIRETWVESLIADAGTFVAFAGMIGLGVWLDSSAMQWTGAVCFFLVVLSMSAAKWQRMTIAQARAKLDELEAT